MSADVHVMLDAVRNELERLAATASAIALPTRPIATEEHPDGPLRIWCDDRLFRVFTVDGGVFISVDHRMEFWPDWTALSRDEARRIGNALLAAAADVPQMGEKP